MGQGPCDKISYKGQKAARIAAKLVGTEAGEKFRAYYCTHCRSWHITSQPGEQKVPLIPNGMPISHGRHLKPGQSLEELAAEMRREKEGKKE